MSIANTGSVDLESVLNVRRRTLASIGESSIPRHPYLYTDTIYLKREDNSNSILSVNSKILIFGELQLLYSIFERYTSNIIMYEESIETNSISPLSSKKTSFSGTREENELNEENLPIVSTLRRSSTVSSKGSPSPPQAPSSPLRKGALNFAGRSHTVGSGTSGEFSSPSLEGKRYGCIQLPNMIMIEILEILLRNGLELTNVSSNYDKENTLHQNFIFSKTRPTSHKYGLFQTRSPSFVGT